MTVAQSGTIFFNKSASFQDVPNHVIKFQFVQQQPFQITKITTLLKSTSGLFNVRGTVKWKEEAHIPSNKTDQKVRDGTLTDSSGTIPISVWGESITKIEETNCKLRHFYGKCLATTRTTRISPAEEQNISKVVEQKNENFICCPNVLNVPVNSFLACDNKDCRKKINSTPGSKIVKCINCNRSMLVKNCYIDVTVNFTVEKDGKEYSMTAFPKVMSLFLEKDIFNYKNDTDTLIEGLLLLENIDFELSQNGRLVTKIQKHETKGTDTENSSNN